MRSGLPAPKKLSTALLMMGLFPSLALLVILPIGSLLVLQETGKFRQNADSRIVAGLGGQVESHLKEAGHVLDQWAKLLSNLDESERGAEFRRLAAATVFFEGAYMLDAGSIVQAEWPLSGNFTGTDFSGILALNRQSGEEEIRWSDSFVSQLTGRSTVSLARSFAGGVLVANLDLHPVALLVAELAEESGLTVSLVDTSGTFLVHPDPSVTTQRETDLIYLSQTRENRGIPFTYQDQSSGSWNVVLVQPLATTGWAVLVTQPLVSHYQPLIPMLWLLIPVLAVLIVGGVGLVRLVKLDLVKSLGTLADQTEGLGRGDLESPSTRTNYIELNMILESFEAMRQRVWLREQDLRLGQQRFRRIFDDAAVGIYHADSKGKLIDLNKALALLLGYSTTDEAKTGLGESCRGLFVGPEEWEALLKMLQDTGAPKLKVTTEFYHRSHSRLVVHHHLARVFDSQLGEFILEGFVEDITELKKAEAEILQLNQELEGKVLERTNHLKRALEDLEMAQNHLVHSEKMAALGQLIAGIAHELNTPLAAIHASNENINFLLTALLGQLPPLLSELPPNLLSLQRSLYEASDRTTSLVSSALIRKRRKSATDALAVHGCAEEEMVDSLAELGEFDDLDQWMPLLLSPWGPEAVRMTYHMVCLEKSCSVIGSASEKAAKVISALRTFTHQAQKSSFERVELKNSIETVLTLFQNRLKAAIVVKTDLDQNAQVWGLADRLNQVWTNLIANALQAMDDQGTLEIAVVSEGGTVRVAVIDSGPGIDAKNGSKIFEPFFTTKKAGEGTGLGLDISKKIIEEHHGRIGFESRPGRTEFYVELPEAR